MKYVIEPGIAALVHVTCVEFPERYGQRRTAFIFMAEGKPIEKGVGDPIEFSALPIRVQAEIAAHFKKVFDMPIEARCEYMKSVPTWEVEA